MTAAAKPGPPCAECGKPVEVERQDIDMVLLKRILVHMECGQLHSPQLDCPDCGQNLWLPADATERLLEAYSVVRAQKAALKNLMDAITPELTGMPKNVPKSSWAEAWEAACAALREQR